MTTTERAPLLADDAAVLDVTSDGANGAIGGYGALKDPARDSSTSSTSSGDEEGKPPKQTYPSVSFFKLFRFATCSDICLMVLGTIFAMIHGGGWPAMSVVFGDMTNTFIQTASPDECGGGGGNMTTLLPPNSSLTTAALGLSTMTTIIPFNVTNSTGPTVPPIDPAFLESEMNKYAIYFTYIGVAVFCAAYFQISCWMATCERQTHKLRKAFFEAILRQEIGWFDKQESGELTTRLADDVERVREGTGDKLSLSIQFISQFIAGFAIGFWKSWKLTLVIMSISPALALCAVLFGRAVQSFSKREQEVYASAGSVAEEVLSCIRTVISFNGQQKECDRYNRALEESRSLGYKKSIVTALGTGFTFLSIYGAYGLGFWYGTVHMVYEYKETGCVDGLPGGEVLTVFFCVMIGSFSLGHIGTHLAAVATSKGSAGFLHWVIDSKPEIDVTANRGPVPYDIRGEIELENVDFAYPSRPDITVVKNIDISVPSGKTVALVGSSGCGKSTILSLIQRFYDPKGGKVKLDGVDIKHINLGWLRSQVGVVSQEPVLFGLTIKENIMLGNPDADFDKIKKCAQDANAHDFIMGLPQGYDTPVGEKGAQLSGGQKQRVAIARSLLRDPCILLLDEATSALDSASEGLVQAALEKASEGRTTIVVAHRLSTIQNADKIIVLEEGQVVEEGSHDELMEKRAAYYQLVTLQALAGAQNTDAGVGEAEEDDPKKPGVLRQVSRGISRHLSKLEDSAEAEEAVEAGPAPGLGAIMRLNSPEWPFMVFGWLGAIVVGSVMPIFAVLFGEVIKVFSYSGQKLKDEGNFWSMMFVVLGVASAVGYITVQSMFGVSGERLTLRLRTMSFRHILRQDATWFDSPRHATGAVCTRLATDAAMVKNATGIRVSVVLQSAVALVAGIAIAMYYGWKLALGIVGAIPFVMIAGTIQVKALGGSQKKDSVLMEDAGKTASEAVENIRTVQSLGREPWFYDTYTQSLLKPHKHNFQHSFIYSAAYAFSQCIVFFLYGGAFRFGAYLVLHDGMPYEDVYKVFSAITFTGMSVGQASSFLPDYTKAKVSAGHIMRLLSEIPGIDNYSTAGSKPASCNGAVELREVEFCYPSRPNVPVLKRISLRFEAGKTTALVGPSGCGKSTIVALLQRMYDPLHGNVMVDGMEVQDVNIQWLRSQMSVVAQEPVLFNCSIKDNIAYGVEGRVSQEEVVAVARQANIHNFVSALPQGYDTPVGEKGAQLSGGQKQRVAIARALLRNPRILLLDEATSALDSHAEKEVQGALDEARAGRTCIVIAHRLATVQNADSIAVVEGGKVVEQGTHAELMARKGAYYALSHRQVALQ